MTSFWQENKIKKIYPAGLLKLGADVLLINFSLLTSLVIRLLWKIAFDPQISDNYQKILWDYWYKYTDSAWLLSLICVVIFFLNGFYTDGRLYRGRYQPLVVIQAVGIAYLIFGALSYLSQGIFFDFLQENLILSPGVLMVSCALSMTFLIAARVWVSIWSQIIHKERQKTEPALPEVRRALIIGGAGYIGSALVPMLLDQGYIVRILDLLIYGKEPLALWLYDPRLEVIQADFRQIDRVVSAMQDVDVVIHLGAIVGDPACDLDQGLTIEINLVATRMIAEIAKGHGVRYFVFASTCAVYGASDQVLDERSPIKPITLYARSKAASEKVLLKMADENFAPVILRFSSVYGLSERYRFDLAVNLLTAKALIDGEITIFNGNQWRSFVHVEDTARSIMHVLSAPVDVVRGQIFNVGCDEQNYSITQIGNMIHGYVPSARIVTKDNDGDPNNFRVGFSKIRKLIGFVPQWTVEKGIEQVRDAILSGRVADYRLPEYSNIKFLTQEGITWLDRHENDWTSRLLDELNENIVEQV